MEFKALTGRDLDAALDDVAALRIAVFAEWPYLYAGALDYERDYLASYQNNPRAVVVGAFDGAKLVGASTGTPLEDHAADFAAPFKGHDLSQWFYCAESVLLPAYRGRGAGRAFFAAREAHARALGRRHSAFCAVIRAPDHPAKPATYRPLDGFWRGLGYAPMQGVIAQFSWTDLGQTAQTAKPLQFWSKSL